MTTDSIPRRQWYRVVDRENQGWHPVGTVEGPPLYAADYGFKRGLPNRSLDDVERIRGPIRPVLPITAEDSALIVETFDRIRRKSITTLAAAIEQVYYDVRESAGGLAAPGSFDYAVRTLLAGREGSWESELLKEVMYFGNSLNLAKSTRGAESIEARRAAGPSRRVDVDGRRVLADMLTRWVSDPNRYTELAETLAGEVSEYCDEHGGWSAVADQWLQPGGLAVEDFRPCYRLFYSKSAHYNPDVA